MVYIFAIVGLLAGFYAGLMLLKVLLKSYSRQDLMQDRKLWRKYGTLCWLVALAGMGLGILIFKIVVP